VCAVVAICSQHYIRGGPEKNSQRYVFYEYLKGRMATLPSFLAERAM